MGEETDEAYYRRREVAARALAANATDPHIARIHLEMADRYAAAIRTAVERAAGEPIAMPHLDAR